MPILLKRGATILKITAVRLTPFEMPISGGHVRAYAEVELEGALLLRGIRVIERENGGWFLGYPSQKTRGGQQDLVVPMDRDFKASIREAVLSAYHQVFQEPPGQKP